MTAPGWPEIVARLHRTLVACDRDTDLELAAGPRRLRLSVRRDTVEGHCPGYDGQQLADLGWRPDGDGGWWHATPRTAEGLHWWSAFAARTAAAVLTADPTALACRVLPPVSAAEAPGAPAVEVTVPMGAGVAMGADAEATHAPGAGATAAGLPGGDVTAPVGNPLPPPTTGPGGTGLPDSGPAAAATPTGVGDPARDPGTDTAGTGGTGPTSTPASPGGADPHEPERVSGRHRAQERAEPARPPSPEQEPEPAELLARAAARHDLPHYLGVLAAGPVCVPLAGEPSPDRDFPWTVVLGADRTLLLPVFSSANALTAFAGDGVPFVALSAAELLADWPDPGWGLAVDPGAAHGLTLTAPALAALLAANDLTGPDAPAAGPAGPAAVEEPDTAAH
ncbi:SseB family protein [Micromonospora sp. NPDC047548]|uniref:SseB family protein n=1 Tax=Micromonospora sp. NPDC047548 TaxID=3155624 RepID=UPI0033EC91B2